ncbi:hypothetical protein KRP22_004425 [Phytophthora ramorum]|nr:hypothetical protein KRP22_13528 [Phytophthora ramorum]
MVVPGPPTAVTLVVYSVSELMVLFSPPNDNGGDTVTAYELQWAIDSAFTIPSSVIVTIMSGVRAPYRRVISSLTKGTPYFVQIRARNSQVRRCLQFGGHHQATTEATLSRERPSTAFVHITGLTPGTLYYVRVFAKNRGGQGTPQTSTPASLPLKFQLMVTLVLALQVPGSCPVVGTTNMVFGGVDLKEYVVQYSEMSDFRIPTEQTTTALTVLLTGLDSSKTYYAQVYAVNSQGLKSAFCKRANTQSLLCPDQQVLLDSSVVTGDFVYAQPL